MNTLNNRTAIFLISAIMAVVATAMFFVVQITITFIIAYLFTILAISMFCAGNLYMLFNAKRYPWFAAFPITIWQYLLAQLSLSTVFIIREVIFPGAFPINIFIFLHIILLGFFAVLLIVLKGGKEIIESKDIEIEQKVFALRLMQADVEAIMRRNPQHEVILKKVIESLKYSDPMSHPSIEVYDERIQCSILSMADLENDDSNKILKACEELQKQIADRNSRVKLMK